jgi:cysteine sulfinate desulfinase/cysteine desulfurase-like protein
MKRMPVDQYGVVNPNDVAQAITDRTVLVRLYRQFAKSQKNPPASLHQDTGGCISNYLAHFLKIIGK